MALTDLIELLRRYHLTKNRTERCDVSLGLGYVGNVHTHDTPDALKNPPDCSCLNGIVFNL